MGLPMGKKGIAGGLAWLALGQFFVLHLVVQSAWPRPYSWVRNDISDLGSTACGAVGGRHVCSPWHAAMNVSFVISGVCIAAGAVLLAGTLRAGWPARAAAALLTVAGAGVVLVGLNPGDLRIAPHLAGAVAAAAGGNAGVLLLGVALRRAGRPVGTVGVVAGVLGFVGMAVAALQLAGVLGGLHVWSGATERVAMLPMLVAMIVIGAAALRSTGPSSTGPSSMGSSSTDSGARRRTG
ncbi:hypothetical membrane protein [Amycolatopsis arida]|uniref:Hypothetical membrane protein n=1 Tax=Amycolatopsis arida TaxID=587909 RepID=A0A1I5R616_9PSEU|nr:DUF998 domain-containing protein [Amycolatopsis arida]TDX99094.1 putative membrane protein [Amycolatopsis arida]SFP53968.1 hypothetical membrane protein [Amycolatopsis arida]